MASEKTREMRERQWAMRALQRRRSLRAMLRAHHGAEEGDRRYAEILEYQRQVRELTDGE